MASCTSPRASCSTTCLQLGVFLAHDLFELDRLHTGVLKLCERSSGFNRFMLATVTDQQHPIVRMEPLYKIMHLPGRSE